MMLGLLLARAGIDVLVLEKHEDFLRDFGGKTIHPSNAVAALNLLAAPLCEDRLTIRDLHQVQYRRAWPTQMTQRLQVFLQNRVISRVLHVTRPLSPPFFLPLLAHFPLLRATPARLIGIGIPSRAREYAERMARIIIG